MIITKIRKQILLFYLGGMGYSALELLWRGRTHSSMFVLGGLCFLSLGKLQKSASRFSLPLRLLAGAGTITSLEFLTGLLVNRTYAVWDYRNLPLNFQGQICLPYTLLWIPVSGGAMWLHTLLDRKLDQSC